MHYEGANAITVGLDAITRNLGMHVLQTLDFIYGASFYYPGVSITLGISRVGL